MRCIEIFNFHTFHLSSFNFGPFSYFIVCNRDEKSNENRIVITAMRMPSQCADDTKMLDFCGRFVQKKMYVDIMNLWNI